MAKTLTNMAVFTETKELVCKIATETNEKKCAIFHRAILDYARKKAKEMAAANK